MTWTEAEGAPNPVHAGEADQWGGWDWRPPSRGEHFRTCNFCGSIHPEDLVMDENWHPEWATPKYGWPHKFYVDVPNRDPLRLYVLSSAPFPADGLTAWADLTDAEREAVTRDGKPYPDPPEGGWFRLGHHGVHHAKLYTAHLADPRLPLEVREEIERKSGVWFSFEGGQVTWRRLGGG